MVTRKARRQGEPGGQRPASLPVLVLETGRDRARAGGGQDELLRLRDAFAELDQSTDVEDLAVRAVRLPELLVGTAACRLDLTSGPEGEQREAWSHPASLAATALGRASHKSFTLRPAGAFPGGTLEAFWRRGDPPSDTGIIVMELLAAHLAVLFENLYRRERERFSLYALDAEPGRAVDADSMLADLIRRIMRACSAECGAFLLRDTEQDALAMRVCVERARGTAEASAECERCTLCWPSHGGLIATAGTGHTPILVEDIAASLPSVNTDIRSVISVPMFLHGQPFGVISLGHSQPHAFTGAHLQLLSALAEDAALVIHNLQNWLAAEESALTAERNRIAKEIHDGVAQDLAFLALRASNGEEQPAEAASTLHQIRELLLRDIDELRRAINALQPADLEKLGLEQALQKLVAELGQRFRLKTELVIEANLPRLDPSRETAVFQTVQEAINNTAKHARAETIRVRIGAPHASQVLIEVRDDGCGFAPDALPPSSQYGGTGLRRMRERIALLGGAMEVQSTPRQGTTLRVTLPAASTNQQ